MMESEEQKKAPRYVLVTPGANKGDRDKNGNIHSSSQLLSVFSAPALSGVLSSCVSSPHVLTSTLQGRYHYLYFTNKEMRLREVKEHAGGHPGNECKTMT